MIVCFLTCLCFLAWIQRCNGQTVFYCPRPVAYGDSAVLQCFVPPSTVNIDNPHKVQVGVCTSTTCEASSGMEEKINITRRDNRVHLTVQTIGKGDDGEWTCQSGSETASCSLYVYKLPSCEISSTSPTNDLTIGQDLTLNISLSDYYCTNSIVWNLHIGGSYQNITELRDQEETENITSRVVTYSPVVTPSLTGRVELTYNCNDELYDVSCSGVEELKLQGAIDNSHNKFELIIGLIVSAFVFIVIVVVICIIKRKKSKMKDVPYVPSSSPKITNNDTYTEVSHITGSLKRNHFGANGVNGGLGKSLGTGNVVGSHTQLIDYRETSERNDINRSY